MVLKTIILGDFCEIAPVAERMVISSKPLKRNRKCQRRPEISYIDLANNLLLTCIKGCSKLLPQALFAPNGEGGCPCQTHRGAGGAQEPGWEYFAKSLN